MNYLSTVSSACWRERVVKDTESPPGQLRRRPSAGFPKSATARLFPPAPVGAARALAYAQTAFGGATSPSERRGKEIRRWRQKKGEGREKNGRSQERRGKSASIGGNCEEKGPTKISLEWEEKREGRAKNGIKGFFVVFLHFFVCASSLSLRPLLLLLLPHDDPAKLVVVEEPTRFLFSPPPSPSYSRSRKRQMDIGDTDTTLKGEMRRRSGRGRREIFSLRCVCVYCIYGLSE